MARGRKSAVVEISLVSGAHVVAIPAGENTDLQVRSIPGAPPIGRTGFVQPILASVSVVPSLVQRVDRRGRDDSFDAARQFCVQRYERVCLQLGECDVFGVVGRGPSQLIR